ncbi:hypothetical protein M378DRAFT_28455 [Amanita muscaria Koide BX008]|uniref:Uncharacterized protein n=1 Tax=Amanita muscaria (strain Koide BX008) TaxID=946122 RepID=A0A0C2WH39_AMAMK|nr:hypothetical protein M378DRAFT_28455 [Amanita muscaria Koide BX008]
MSCPVALIFVDNSGGPLCMERIMDLYARKKVLMQEVRRVSESALEEAAYENIGEEELPIAPRLELRQPTAAELALQVIRVQFCSRLGPILGEYKRARREYGLLEDCNFDFFYALPLEVVVNPVNPVRVHGNPKPLVDANLYGNIINVVDEAGATETTAVNGGQWETTEEGLQQHYHQLQLQSQQQQAVLLEHPELYYADLARMDDELYRGRYLTPQDFQLCIPLRRLASLSSTQSSGRKRQRREPKHPKRAPALSDDDELDIIGPSSCFVTRTIASTPAPIKAGPSGHILADGGERLLLTMFLHQRLPTPHITPNDNDSNIPPFFTTSAISPPPPQEAALVPLMSVDTHMQSHQPGMEVVDPSRSCRNVAGFQKVVNKQAQHLESPQEVMVVVVERRRRYQTSTSTNGYWLNSDVDRCKIRPSLLDGASKRRAKASKAGTGALGR